MTTYIEGMRSLEVSSGANILAGRRVRDVRNEIALLDAGQTALYTLLAKLRKKAATDVKFEWFEDVFPAQATTASGDGDSTDSTSLVVASGTGSYGRPGDVWLNGDSGEMFYIISVSTDTWTVIRQVGGSTADEVDDGDALFYVGNAQMTGDQARDQLTTQTVNPYNYCQIFKEGFEVDNTANATKLYGGPDLVYLRRKHAEIHKRDMERMLWFGLRDDLTASDNSNITTTAFMSKGVIGDGTNGFLTSNTATNDSSEYTEDEFDADLRTAFRYGNAVKFAFCAPLPLSVISSWGRAALQTVPRDTTYGINITRYISPHGELNLINNKLFFDMTGAGIIDYTKLVVILDLEEMWLRTLRDTRLEMGIQENDKDAIEDQYLTEVGLELHNEKNMMDIRDFDIE